MRLDEIRDEIEIKLFDSTSYGKDQIDSYINDCVQYVAGLVPLPSLKRVGTVSTVVDQAYVNIAESINFSGDLKKVIKLDEADPFVYPDIERMMEVYSMDETGSVEAVALEGNVLWYAYTPEEAETLTLIYYANPARLTMNEDVPSDIPLHCHRKLLVHGTLWMLFDEIENASSLEGEKVKTREHYWMSFNTANTDSGINDLRTWLARTRPHHISSVWNY